MTFDHVRATFLLFIFIVALPVGLLNTEKERPVHDILLECGAYTFAENKITSVYQSKQVLQLLD